MYFGMEDKNISFFLERLTDGPDNELTIIITKSREMTPSPDSIKSRAGSDEHLLKILLGCQQLVPDNTHSYKISFDNYITYQMRNESYCSYDPDENRVGHGLLLFSKSKFLDYLSKATDAFDDGKEAYPAKFKHYGVYTLNHIIDIISHREPIIEKINL